VVRIDPVWTLATGSLFLIRTTADSFFKDSNFICFSVRDMDSFRPNNETLGTVEISKKKLLLGTGERLVYELVPPEKIKKRKHTVDKKVDHYSLFAREPSIFDQLSYHWTMKIVLSCCEIQRSYRG
jgi:hypothetical protein